MSKMKVALIGWRGMVGSVLVQRMQEEGDFDHIDASYFSTSNAGDDGPDGQPLGEAYDSNVLSYFDVIMTCQGSDYTKKVHSELRESNWQGYWIDAASGLRMADESVLLLDPVNRDVIDKALDDGTKDLIGINCTVSPMMMALAGLFKENLIEWVSSMTYQAASGAGSRHMIELLKQMHTLGSAVHDVAVDPAKTILEIDAKTTEVMRSDQMPTEQFGHVLAGSLLPWIDTEMDNGQSREEWKAQAETNKVLGQTDEIKVDGTCVRISAMRTHSMGLIVKLNQDMPIEEIEDKIKNAHQWVTLVENTKEASNNLLTPAAVSGSLQVNIGRLRKTNLGPDYLNAFVVADQLLWGAAEPLRRALRILIERNNT